MNSNLQNFFVESYLIEKPHENQVEKLLKLLEVPKKHRTHEELKKISTLISVFNFYLKNNNNSLIKN